MSLYSAVSCELYAKFYQNGRFVDLRTVDKKTAKFLHTMLDYELNTGSFENMTKNTDVSVKNRFGSLKFDADDDEDVERFFNFWITPHSRILVDGWSVILEIYKKTVYDSHGNIVTSQTW